MRGATRPFRRCEFRRYISIHAPLAGCDGEVRERGAQHDNFNPRTPCGVRPYPSRPVSASRNFNPRTPCGVRHASGKIVVKTETISIHAPLAGCDMDNPLFFHLLYLFQSTHPLRGATSCAYASPGFIAISIHAPLAGCDRFFLNTPSPNNISIHAPLAGCDGSASKDGKRPYNFNPRTPCGVRRRRQMGARRRIPISIHAPLAGCDFLFDEDGGGPEAFQSTHPLRGATVPRSARAGGLRHFNPRTPCGVRLHERAHNEHLRDFNPRTPCGVRQQNCRNIPGKFAQKLQNFCKAKQRAALSRVGQRESGRYFRPCAVRTSRGKPERFRFASDNERALRSVARL